MTSPDAPPPLAEAQKIMSMASLATELRSEAALSAAISLMSEPLADGLGLNTLHRAAATGWARGCALLLDSPFGPDLAQAVNSKGRSALIMAAQSNHPESVKALIALSQIDQRCETGDTALLISAKSLFPECVALLAPLSHPQARDSDRSDALIAALLHAKNIDEHEIDDEDDEDFDDSDDDDSGASETLADPAQRRRERHQRVLLCVKALAPYSDIEAQTIEMDTPLMICAAMDHQLAASLCALLAPLLRPGSRSRAKAFAIALENGAWDAAKALLPAAHIDAPISVNGASALMLAVEHNALDLIPELMRHSDPYQSFFIRKESELIARQSSALSLAFELRRYETLPLLASKTNPFEAIDSQGLSPLVHALIAAQPFKRQKPSAASRALALFLDQTFAASGQTPLPADCSAAFLAALGAARDDWATRLFPHADLRQKSLTGSSNALIMASGGMPSWTIKLLPLFSPEQIKEPNQYGSSALMISAALNDPISLRALAPLSNPSQLDENGCSALMLATAHPDTACLEALLPISDASLFSRDGLSAFLFAAQLPNERAMALLAPLSDTRALTKRGFDAIDCALLNRNLDWGSFQRVCQILSEQGELPVNAQGQSALSRAEAYFENSARVEPQSIRSFFNALEEARQCQAAMTPTNTPRLCKPAPRL